MVGGELKIFACHSVTAPIQSLRSQIYIYPAVPFIHHLLRHFFNFFSDTSYTVKKRQIFNTLIAKKWISSLDSLHGQILQNFFLFSTCAVT
jgi:hypothetical protein